VQKGSWKYLDIVQIIYKK